MLLIPTYIHTPKTYLHNFVSFLFLTPLSDPWEESIFDLPPLDLDYNYLIEFKDAPVIRQNFDPQNLGGGPRRDPGRESPQAPQTAAPQLGRQPRLKDQSQQGLRAG